MGNYNWDSDLKEGHGGEEIVLKYVRAEYPEAHRVEGYFPDYDIFVPRPGKDAITLEVKYDKKVEESGNYLIETEYNGKSCGVYTTKADYWVEVDANSIIIMEIGALRHFLKGYDVTTLPPKKTSLGGKGYLVPRDALLYRAKMGDSWITLISRGGLRGE